jgi:hypothetical protein
MDTTSVAYVLCRIEDDSSLTPVSQHGDFLTGIAAGGYAVEVEDSDFAYALYAGDPSNGSSTRVASFREGRIGYREWATRSAPACDASRAACTMCSVVGGLRAVFWYCAGGGLPLPQAKAPTTVARRVIHFGPEPWRWDSGLCTGGWGGSQKLADALLGAHTP